MKKLTLYTFILFLVVAGVALLMHFGIIKPKYTQYSPTTATTTVATTAEPTTEPPTTEPPTTEPPTTTEPEPAIESSGKTVIYEGVSIDTYYIDGDSTLMVLASDVGEESTEEYIPLLETAENRGYPMWQDEEQDVLYITPSATAFEIPEDVNVPVLMYHAVSDDMWGISELFVSPSDMEDQLAYLVENGYDPIWFQDLSHVEDYDKPVILTFDDGYDDNYTELLPLLQKYQVKATVFVIGNAMGKSHKMTEEQVKALSDSGLVTVQSHGYTHHDMDVMGEEELDYELGETYRVITRVTGKIPSVLCYPTGKYSSLTIDVAQRYYNFALKMNGGLYNTSGNGPYEVNRYYVSRYTDIYTFASFISEAGK